MISQLTTNLFHLLQCIFMNRNILSDHKECCMCVVLLQCLQQLQRSWSRAIIKCKRYHRFLRINFSRFFRNQITFFVKFADRQTNIHFAGYHLSIIFKIICILSNLLPAGYCSSGLRHIILIRAILLPAGLHDSFFIEMICCTLNCMPASRHLAILIKIISITTGYNKIRFDISTIVTFKFILLPPSDFILYTDFSVLDCKLYFLTPVIIQLLL